MPWQDYLPSYRSVRFIEVKNWKLALVHILLQLAVILYVVVYSIVIKQSYQEYDPLVGTTAIKVKGSAQQNGTTNGQLLYNGTVFDSYDLVIPPTEANALFIATNVIRTFNQTRGVCPGNDVSKELCSKGCIAGTHTYNGIMTGACANTSTNANATHFCELRTWCPLEYEDKKDQKFMREHFIHGVEEWSIFARANIKFTKFNESKTNAPNGVLVPGLNQWTLAELVAQTGFTFQDVQSLGAIILVTFSYECDLDHSIDECDPDIHFQRIDPTAPTSDQPGFNFRYVDRYFDADGTERRALTKAYGVRILFQLIGKAGKFNIVPLLVALGSGLGLLSVATIVCDFVMQYLLPARKRYKREKIIDVPDEDPMSPRNQQPHVQDGREPLLESSGSFAPDASGVGLQQQHGPRTFST